MNILNWFAAFILFVIVVAFFMQWLVKGDLGYWLGSFFTAA